MNLTALFSIALTSKRCTDPAELVWIGPWGFSEVPPRAKEGPFSIHNYTYYEKAIPHPALGWPAPRREYSDERCLASEQLLMLAPDEIPRRSPLSVGFEALMRLLDTYEWESENRAAVVVLDRAPGWAGAGAKGVSEWNEIREYPPGGLSDGGWGSISFAKHTDGVERSALQEYWQLAALLKRYDTARSYMDQEELASLARLHQKLGPHPWPTLAPFNLDTPCRETDYPTEEDLSEWLKASGIRLAALVTHGAAELLDEGSLAVEGLRVGHLDSSSADLLARLLCAQPNELISDGRSVEDDRSKIAIGAASAGFAVSILGLGLWKGASWCGGRGRTKPLRGTDISEDESIELDDRYTETSDRERIQRVNFDMFT